MHGSPRLADRIAPVLFALLLAARVATAQTDAALQGTVRDAGTSRPLAGITVMVSGGRAGTTDGAGRFRIPGIAPGSHTVLFRWLGYAPRTDTLVLAAGEQRTLDASLRANPVLLGLVRVSGASRVPERVVDAPAAVVAVEPARVRDLAGGGQVPMLVGDLTGVRTAQAGLFDFNVNTRGFNTPLNRRTLVLIDGRDVSIPMLGNQEWADLSVLEDATQVEMVRGPGSSLYGANAFSGVLAITTPAVRETRGTRLNVSTGDLSLLKVDARQAWLSTDDRWGFRVSAGFQQSETWDRSRTNLGDLEAEYGAAGFGAGAVSAPAPGYELLPLFGQTKAGAFGLPGAASGSADPTRVIFGTLRADRYNSNGSIFTLEGGTSTVENNVITTGAGRSQIKDASRPWARAALTGEDYSIFGYFTGRDGDQTALASATQGLDRGSTVHLEGQRSFRFAGDRGRWVAGASARQVSVDSRGTILDASEDGRTDGIYALFQQLDYAVLPNVKLIAGGRVDGGSQFSSQFSPKLGVVVTPKRDQSLRLTWNRGYLAPSAFQRFLRFPAGAPVNLTGLENGLRASPLGPALVGVPVGALFTVSATVPIFALGNEGLKPEVVSGVELGYKAQIGRLFLTVDMYQSTITDFATSLMPASNPDYPLWTAPPEVPEVARASVEQAALGAVGSALSRQGNGNTAFIVSFGNAGRATEVGAELGAAFQLNDVLRLDANYTWYDFSIDQDQFAPGDTIDANAPPHAANLAATWQRAAGVRLRVGARYTDAFAYRVGTWRATLPSTTALDVNVSVPVREAFTLSLAATNLLDQRRVHSLGGSAIERRLVVTLGWRR